MLDRRPSLHEREDVQRGCVYLSPARIRRDSSLASSQTPCRRGHDVACTHRSRPANVISLLRRRALLPPPSPSTRRHALACPALDDSSGREVLHTRFPSQCFLPLAAVHIRRDSPVVRGTNHSAAGTKLQVHGESIDALISMPVPCLGDRRAVVASDDSRRGVDARPHRALCSRTLTPRVRTTVSTSCVVGRTCYLHGVGVPLVSMVLERPRLAVTSPSQPSLTTTSSRTRPPQRVPPPCFVEEST